jgi:protein SCO1/2
MKSRLAVVLLFVSAIGCERTRSGADPAALRGWLLEEPVPKADFKLLDTEGKPFSFVEETEGGVTLLFFGFTTCPDVCPVHLANIGSVIKKLSPEDANQIRVVFVATDPERDTPERVRAWLDNFHPHFVGLVGTQEDVNRIEESFGLSASFREEWPDGGYGIAHAAQVLAFTRDNNAHVMYPFGIRQVDWAHDLPLLVKNDTRAIK